MPIFAEVLLSWQTHPVLCNPLQASYLLDEANRAAPKDRRLQLVTDLVLQLQQEAQMLEGMLKQMHSSPQRPQTMRTVWANIQTMHKRPCL